MVRACWVVALMLGVVVHLPAGEQPKGSPPRVMKADVDPNGRPYLTIYIPEIVQKEVTEKVLINGREENRTRKVPYQMNVPVKIGLNDPGVKVYDLNGKRVDAKKLTFSGPKAVLVSADNHPVDPFYLRLAREGTLVVVTNRDLSGTPKVFPPPPPKEGKQPK